MSKKINDILKGVAGAGVVVGGANVIAENEIIFASEIEQSESQYEEYEEYEELASASDSVSDSISEYVEPGVVYVQRTMLASAVTIAEEGPEHGMTEEEDFL